MQSAFSCFHQENRWQGSPYPQYPVVFQKGRSFFAKFFYDFSLFPEKAVL